MKSFPDRTVAFVGLRFQSVGFIVALVLMGTSMGCIARYEGMKHDAKVQMSGRMNGDMRLGGKMGLDGKLTTEVVMGGDNRESKLRPIMINQSPSPTNHRIAILDVDGYLIDRTQQSLISSSENPVALFREKCDAVIDDPTVKAVVIRINSPGGGVTASDIMCQEIRRMNAQRRVPVVACLMGVGAGGAYLLANQCDLIVAHPTSLVGGVGVILNVYNLEDTMGQFNILSTPIKSGEKIDAGTPERAVNEDEQAMLQDIANSFHRRFIDDILYRRPQAEQSESTWTDGSVYVGPRALQMGLVDEIGYIDDAIRVARERAGLNENDPIVMYRRNKDHAYTALDSFHTSSSLPSIFPIRLPGLDRSTMPTFLYMWQSDPSMAAIASP